MEICDRVMGDQNGPKESVQSLIKRLAHRNANVQLYTLEVSLISLRRRHHILTPC
jgi:signal transducing adaptor molecule